MWADHLFLYYFCFKKYALIVMPGTTGKCGTRANPVETQNNFPANWRGMAVTHCNYTLLSF